MIHAVNMAFIFYGEDMLARRIIGTIKIWKQ